jgi:hypothetical protein
MLAVALPFVWMGIALSVKRLRDASLPIWLVFLFFVPLTRFFFAVINCVVPGRRPEAGPSADSPREQPKGWHIVPRSSGGSATASVVLTALLGLGLTGFNVFCLGVYGLGLFVGLPFCLGIIATVLHGYHQPRSAGSYFLVAILSVFVTGGFMILFPFEGAGCLIMAFPIWMGCTLLGCLVGIVVLQQARRERDLALLTISLTLAIPALMGAEAMVLPEAPLFEVHSEIDVPAAPAMVWRQVVEFPALPTPDEWYFRAGIAYPTHATIDGRGPGAVRRCEFSTGAFIEPIRVWEEPRHLAFDVTHNPPPMREFSFYEDIHAPHLDGFMQARRGEFRLTSLANGGTRLEGITWYQHHMWPASYWRLWSDWLIHRIHLRVLHHIRATTPPIAAAQESQ